MNDRSPRRAGILLHPTALPGRSGSGDLGPEAVGFLDALARAGISLWQVLPLGPAGAGGSPYDSASAFAGNRHLISPERMEEEGMGTGLAAAASPDGDLSAWRDAILQRAWDGFRSKAGAEVKQAFDSFRSDPAERPWLDDWTLFAALKRRHGDVPWISWPAPLAHREPAALVSAREELSAAIDFEAFVQFVFFRQWAAVREAARSRGIAILGDLPIYVSYDSADVWAHRELFDLAPDGSPLSVSGVPPDYFSRTGQRWGTPVYRWDVAGHDGYRWWIERFRANLRLADAVRIDHFRGFVSYWAVPASEPTAASGGWRPGPGGALFEAARQALGCLPFVAEDLGVITPDVEGLRDGLALPGMRVLQFGFARDDDAHLPHRHVAHCVAYTGTHDNDTSRGWFANAPAGERRRASDYLGVREPDVAWAFIRGVFASVAETAIVPMQDVLELGGQARFNTPGETAGNWRWRMPDGAFTPELARRLRRLVEATGRAPR
jgi:4-alpha-glucanotransferase